MNPLLLDRSVNKKILQNLGGTKYSGFPLALLSSFSAYGYFVQVWCDNGYPRLIQRPLEMAITGKVSKRCACFTEDELNQPGLEVYEGCHHLSKLCRL